MIFLYHTWLFLRFFTRRNLKSDSTISYHFCYLSAVECLWSSQCSTPQASRFPRSLSSASPVQGPPCGIALHCTVLYCTAQHCTVLYYMSCYVLYCIAQLCMSCTVLQSKEGIWSAQNRMSRDSMFISINLCSPLSALQEVSVEDTEENLSVFVASLTNWL